MTVALIPREKYEALEESFYNNVVKVEKSIMTSLKKLKSKSIDKHKFVDLFFDIMYENSVIRNYEFGSEERRKEVNKKYDREREIFEMLGVSFCITTYECEFIDDMYNKAKRNVDLFFDEFVEYLIYECEHMTYLALSDRWRKNFTSTEIYLKFNDEEGDCTSEFFADSSSDRRINIFGIRIKKVSKTIDVYDAFEAVNSKYFKRHALLRKKYTVSDFWS